MRWSAARPIQLAGTVSQTTIAVSAANQPRVKHRLFRIWIKRSREGNVTTRLPLMTRPSARLACLRGGSGDDRFLLSAKEQFRGRMRAAAFLNMRRVVFRLQLLRAGRETQTVEILLWLRRSSWITQAIPVTSVLASLWEAAQRLPEGSERQDAFRQIGSFHRRVAALIARAL